MTTDSAFLAQTYSQIWSDYHTSLTSTTTRQWDYVVITASNSDQAQAFSDQIDARKRSHRLPSNTQFLCIPDRNGTRVGSGGATLSVLKEIVDRESSFRSFNDYRILVIHSGGDSKRVPQYSACGKLFSPVPRSVGEDQRDTLFDEFMALAATFPESVPAGMVVGSGDVLLLFNPSQIVVEGGDAVAMASKVSIEVGVEHGVFLSDEDGEIIEFLHKQPAEILHAKGAVDADGNVDLDIGFVWLSGDVTDALWRVISEGNRLSQSRYEYFVNDSVRLSFYADFLFPLASHSTLEQYYKETPEFRFSDELIDCRRQLWPLLHRFKMTIQKLSPAIYVHFGTTTELRSLMTDELAGFRCLGWQPTVLSWVPRGGRFTAINSFVSEDVSVGEGTYLEDTLLVGGCRIGKQCIVSNLDLQAAIEIPDGTAVHVLPVFGTKFCARTFHVTDNPKKWEFFGVPLVDLLEFYRIPIEQVFDGEDHSLWAARLYPICETGAKAAEAIAFVLKFVARAASDSEVSEWLAQSRNSLSFSNADINRILDWQTTLQRRVQASFNRR
jgi:fucokinase